MRAAACAFFFALVATGAATGSLRVRAEREQHVLAAEEQQESLDCFICKFGLRDFVKNPVPNSVKNSCVSICCQYTVAGLSTVRLITLEGVQPGRAYFT